MDKKQKKLLKHLIEGKGIISYACQKAGVSRQTFYNWKKDDPEFAQAVDDVNEDIIDIVESKLLTQINDNNLTAIIFFLKTKGRARGYVEQTDVNANLNGSFALRPLTDDEIEELHAMNQK
jgi:hypothetical protein